MTRKQKKDNVSAAQTMMLLERLARLVRSASQTAGLYPVQWEALRYLARANQFSNSPRAMARYLGSTKGTVSQTVAVLIKKNLVEKAVRSVDARSIALKLTPAGQALLQNDPLQPLEKSIANLTDKTAKRFGKGMAEILSLEVARQKEPSFGTCKTCRYWRSKGSVELSRCKKFEVEIKNGDVNLVCVEHVSAD